MPKHKKNPEVGTKQTTFSSIIYIDQKDAKNFAQDEEVTFMDWGNAFIRKITGSPVIETIEVELNLEGDFKKTKQKITWLGESASAPFVPVKLLDYDYLITKKKVEEDDELKDLLTKTTEFHIDAVADANVKLLKKGDIIQFERIGYFIVDKAFGEPAHDAGREEVLDRVDLILIPDGKAASVASKAPVAAPKAAAKAAKAPATVVKIAEPAPTEAVETILLSEGSKGFPQPVTTKMFKVDSLCALCFFSVDLVNG